MLHVLLSYFPGTQPVSFDENHLSTFLFAVVFASYLISHCESLDQFSLLPMTVICFLKVSVFIARCHYVSLCVIMIVQKKKKEQLSLLPAPSHPPPTLLPLPPPYPFRLRMFHRDLNFSYIITIDSGIRKTTDTFRTRCIFGSKMEAAIC